MGLPVAFRQPARGKQDDTAAFRTRLARSLPDLGRLRQQFGGFVEGHGTMDTYAFTGNNGAFQPVNCPTGGWGWRRRGRRVFA